MEPCKCLVYLLFKNTYVARNRDCILAYETIYFLFMGYPNRCVSNGRFRDETVDVGAPLCEIDTDVEATLKMPSKILAPTASAPSPTPVPEPAVLVASSVAPVPVSSISPKAKSRTPSIKFLGKDGWATALAGQVSEIVYVIPANYGRLKFTDEEMDALVLGGANMAPDIKEYSGGARFSA